MHVEDPSATPIIIAQELSEGLKFFPADADDARRMPIRVPFALLVLYARNIAGTIGRIALLNSFRMVQVENRVKAIFNAWITIRVQTERRMVMHACEHFQFITELKMRTQACITLGAKRRGL